MTGLVNNAARQSALRYGFDPALAAGVFPRHDETRNTSQLKTVTSASVLCVCVYVCVGQGLGTAGGRQ